MDLLNELILQAVASPWIYLVLFAVAVIDGFFPPVPSETVLVAAAAVSASTGSLSLGLLCGVAALGAMIGDNIAYEIGRRVGADRFRWMRRPAVASAFDSARRALSRSGAGLLLGARYIPVGRVAVNMSAGALGYPWRRFLPLSMIGASTWALYSVVIGVAAGHWLEDQPLLSAVIGVVLALAVGVVIDRIRTRRRAAPLARTAATAAADIRADRTEQPEVSVRG